MGELLARTLEVLTDSETKKLLGKLVQLIESCNVLLQSCRESLEEWELGGMHSPTDPPMKGTEHLFPKLEDLELGRHNCVICDLPWWQTNLPKEWKSPCKLHGISLDEVTTLTGEFVPVWTDCPLAH